MDIYYCSDSIKFLNGKKQNKKTENRTAPPLNMTENTLNCVSVIISDLDFASVSQRVQVRNLSL